MNLLDQTAYPRDATRLLAGIVVPDTPIVSRAIELAREHCEPYLFNHVMRSWLFAQLIWDGIALNSTPSIGLYKENEVALCTMGIGLDWGGWGYDMLTETQVATIVDAFPRLRMKQRFTRDVCGIVEPRPATTYVALSIPLQERQPWNAPP